MGITEEPYPVGAEVTVLGIDHSPWLASHGPRAVGERGRVRSVVNPRYVIVELYDQKPPPASYYWRFDPRDVAIEPESDTA